MSRSRIVDAQVHIGPGGIDEMIAAMDALGIAAALVDEYWFGKRSGDPYHLMPNGAMRPISPTAELATALHPDRFAYLIRLDRADPELAAVIRMARTAPHARALRISPGMGASEAEAFANGGYRPLLAAACESGLPLFVFAPGQIEAIAVHARAFPTLRIIVDHCGLMSNLMRQVVGAPDRMSLDEQGAAFEDVLTLAELPNVALKWGHAPAMFEAAGYPNAGTRPFLRQAIDCFGVDRIMWASDVSANQTGESWAELLFALRDNPGLSETEKAALLGGTVRQWLDWPA